VVTGVPLRGVRLGVLRPGVLVPETAVAEGATAEALGGWFVMPFMRGGEDEEGLVGLMMVVTAISGRGGGG
jgi:hypothetical protein